MVLSHTALGGLSQISTITLPLILSFTSLSFFLVRAVARVPISGFFRHSVILSFCLSLLASREVLREAIGIKAV